MQNKIYISNDNTGNNIRMTNMIRVSGWEYGNSNPLTNLGGGTHHFNISLDHDKIINTLNSYISYKVKFVMNVDEEKLYNDAGKVRGLGRYFIKNNMLYFAPLVKNGDGLSYVYPA